MENNTNVSFKFFDQALVQRVINFTELNEKTKESIKALSEEIKNIYITKDADLKQEIKNQLVILKQNHINNLEELDKNLASDLEKADKETQDAKELHNIKFGLETACKRAKIKEKFSGFRSLIKILSPSIPVRERSHAVTVVPILEPIITPIV